MCLLTYWLFLPLIQVLTVMCFSGLPLLKKWFFNIIFRGNAELKLNSRHICVANYLQIGFLMLLCAERATGGVYSRSQIHSYVQPYPHMHILHVSQAQDFYTFWEINKHIECWCMETSMFIRVQPHTVIHLFSQLYTLHADPQSCPSPIDVTLEHFWASDRLCSWGLIIQLTFFLWFFFHAHLANSKST